MTTELNQAQAPVEQEVLVETPAPTPKRRRRIASLDKRKARAGWMFVLPFLIGLIFVYAPIIFNSLRFTFGQLEAVRGGTYNFTFMGLTHYKNALTGASSAQFLPTLVTGMKELVIDIPAIVIFSLFMAVLLNQKMLGRAAFRAIFFIPVIVATGVVGEQDAANALMNYMSSGSSIDTGAGNANQIVSITDISKLFENMAVGSNLALYVADLVNDIYGIINRSGVQMLIFLAGLQSISGAIYESCSIDGASAWETFWKITLPMVSPMILVNTVYTVIDSFTSSSNSVMMYISSIYSQTDGDVLSSAMAWIYFTIVILIILVVVAVLRTVIFYQRKD